MTDSRAHPLLPPRLTLRYATAFYLAFYLAAMAHEAGHLLVGRVACGSWVGMTFNLIQWPAGCAEDSTLALLAGLAGPLVTYLTAWFGALLLARPERAPLGFLLLFASHPFARAFTAWMGGGDELGVARTLWGPAGRWPMVAIVTVLALAPIAIGAWRIPALRHPLRLVGWSLLPMLFDFVLRHKAMEQLLPRYGGAALLGVPTLVWAVFGTALAAFLLLGPRRSLQLTPSAAEPQP